jgi:hypothetical protein
MPEPSIMLAAQNRPLEDALPSSQTALPPRTISAAGLRRNVVLGNLFLIGATMLFFIIAPILGFPGGHQFSFDLSQIALPVFVGYLSFAAVFAAGSVPAQSLDPERGALLGLLAYGSMGLYFVIAMTSCIVFWITQRGDGPALEPGLLKTLLTISLSLCTGVCNHVIARLFPQGSKPGGRT